MEIWQAIVLGLVQGLTEFLPVSSSGHLILIRDIFGIGGDFLFFDIMLHLATLVAVCAVLYKEIISLIYPKPTKKLLYLVFASIPAVVTGVLVALFGGEFFESGKYLCFFFLLTAVLLLLTETLGKKLAVEKDGTITLKTAVLMGAAQGAAVFSGLSRSGSTVAAGVLSGADRNAVARFSFLMSLPIILGSLAFESLKMASRGQTSTAPAWCVVVGMLFAAVSGFAALKVMLRAVQRANFKYFSAYLFVLSVITFINYFVSPIW